MAFLGDITSANATLILIVDELFPAGIPLVMFSTDQSFQSEEITVAEARQGVDGHLAVGWIPSLKTVTVTLEAASPSYTALHQLYSATQQRRGFLRCALTASVPSIHKVFTWSEGTMISGQPVPAGQKVLGPTTWKFTFAELNIQG